MLEYWLQNGKVMLREIKESNKDIKTLMDNLFQEDGKATFFTIKYFRHMNFKSKEHLADLTLKSILNMKESPKKVCFACGKVGANKIKGWIFPFVITREKFPNLSNEITICKQCALESFAAYSALLFNTQSNYLSFILFFSDSVDSLLIFRRKMVAMAKELVSGYYRNWKTHDTIYYPFEFLASVINDLTIDMKSEKEIFNREIGAILVGVNVSGSKKIYDYGDVITRVNDIAKLFMKFREKIENIRKARKERLEEAGIYDSSVSDKDPFRVMFSYMKKDIVQKAVTPDTFLSRNLFFKKILKFKDIDWHITEEILFYNIRQNRNLPFLSLFLSTVMEVFNMSEKDLLEKVANMGYSLGRSLIEKGETRDSAKQYLFELRRKRNVEEFLDRVNLIQIKAETTIDDRPFRENERLFYKLKVFFIVGMTNAIFQKKS